LLDELPKAEADILQKFFHTRAWSLHHVMQRGRGLDSESSLPSESHPLLIQ
jgi:hypothetical protein